MSTRWPEKSCANRKRAVEELIKGRDTAAELRTLFKKPATGDRRTMEELMAKVLTSFSETISVLNSSCGSSCEVCRRINIPASTQVGSPSSGDRRSVDSGESSKRPPAPVATKERRGCYKRRKTADTWMKVSPTVEDGHAWRKYGQKEILNAEFPRCYFRCTHKHDQGCLATKQVQRIQESPDHMYQITYFGHHTCKSYTLKTSQTAIILDSDPVEPYLLSFKSPKISSEKQHPVLPPCPSSSIKEEFGEEIQSSNPSGGGGLPPPLESFVWPEMMHLESSSSVYSSASTMSTSHGLDMDFLNFDNDFQFDDTEFI